MKADPWFPTIIWQGDLKQVNNVELAEYVNKLQQESAGRRVSNYGGWQSEAQDLLAQKPVGVEVLLQGIQNSINQCTKMAGLPTLQISDFWWNSNPKGSYNQPTIIERQFVKWSVLHRCPTNKAEYSFTERMMQNLFYPRLPQVHTNHFIKGYPNHLQS